MTEWGLDQVGSCTSPKGTSLLLWVKIKPLNNFEQKTEKKSIYDLIAVWAAFSEIRIGKGNEEKSRKVLKRTWR